MPGINLIIHDHTASANGKPRLRFTKTNTSNQFTPIPFNLDSYTPLLDYITPHLPQEWIDQIDCIYQQERQLIQQRQELIRQYKAQLAITIPPVIAQFQVDHPELFI